MLKILKKKNMKMLMSADSSDCHNSSPSVENNSNNSNNLNNNNNNNPSVKTSVICMPSYASMNTENQITSPAPHMVTVKVEASPASSTTNMGQLLVGRSHLENALKLPPNTSVSSYYQNTKLLNAAPSSSSNNAIQNAALESADTKVVFQTPSNLDYHNHHHHHQQQQQQQQQAASRSAMLPYGNANQNSANNMAPVTDMDTVPTGASTSSAAGNAHKIPHSNVIFINKTTCNINNNTLVLQSNYHQNSNNLPQHNGNHALVVSTSELANPYDNYNHNSASSYASNNNNNAISIYHHSPNQALSNHNHHNTLHAAGQAHFTANNAGNVMIVPADSRPQTPEYIKSYPVMDTTVASSIKGEPELNIGEYTSQK